jgi:hypothetical protein
MSGGNGECPDQLKEYRFKKGESGNPAGRPKRPSFETLVAQVLDEELPGKDCSKREALARVFVNTMLAQNASMIREFLAREWPAVSKHEVDLPGIGSEALDAALDRWLEPVDAPEVQGRSNGSGKT